MEETFTSKGEVNINQLLTTVETLLRNGREEESLKLCKDGLKYSTDLTLKNKFENILFSLL